MQIFEDECSDLEIPDQKFSFDMQLLIATMSVKNTVLSDFRLDKERSKIEIQSSENETAYILMQVEDMSMDFEMDFNIRSRPEWLRDDGTVAVNVTNFDAAIHMVPFNSDGRVQLDFTDAVLNIEDFKVKFNGTSEISEGFEMIVNKFKSIFKDELVNILGRKLTKSVEQSMNKYLFNDEIFRTVGEGNGIF